MTAISTATTTKIAFAYSIDADRINSPTLIIDFVGIEYAATAPIVGLIAAHDLLDGPKIGLIKDKAFVSELDGILSRMS